jgi:hypothetical protein
MEKVFLPMNRRSHIYPELWILLVLALTLPTITVPCLTRRQWEAGGLWLSLLILLTAYLLRDWNRQR